MNVVVLVDLEAVLPSYSEPDAPVWADADFMEAHITETLRAAGHRVRVIPFTGSDTIERLRNSSADIVFNLTLHVDWDRRRAVQIAAILELLGLPYTGAGPEGMLQACDKSLSKHIVRMVGASVPKSLSLMPGTLPVKGSITFPAIIKPRFEGGSEGITDKSLVHNYSELCRRVGWLHSNFKQAAVCEQFIEGREISVGLLGNDDPLVFPIRERVFSKLAEGGPRFATHRVKLDPGYRKRWGIHWEKARLPRHVAVNLQKISMAIYKAIGLRDFGRIDFCLTPKGESFFLEANHLPDCAPYSFGMFAAWVSMDYLNLLHSILNSCLLRNRHRDLVIAAPPARR